MRLGEARSQKDLVQAAEKLRMDRLNARRPFEEIWWNNLALIAGDHYAQYNSQQGVFVETPKEPHAVRLVLNQARVIARTELAKVTKSRPIMEVVPNSTDEEDIAAAKVGKFALDAVEWKFKLRRMRKQALWWTINTGISAIYCGWDPANIDAGMFEVVVDPNTNEPVFHPTRLSELEQLLAQGDTSIRQEQWPLGDMQFRLYHPFQLLPDDTQDWFEDIHDIIVTDVVELEKAKDTWPEVAGRLTAGKGTSDTMLNRILTRAGLKTQSMDGGSQDTIQVHTLWLEPRQYTNRFLASGLMLRWTSHDTVLEFHETFPFNDGRLPFAFYQHTPNATAIWPDCTITDIRDINLELDKTLSQLLENRDYMLNPMWRIAQQSQVATIKSAPGAHVKYVHVRDVPPPEQLPGVPMPSQIENLVIGLRDQILDISGQGEVSRGRLPAGVRSGVQMSYLQEEDETKLGPVTEEFEDGTSVLGSLILSRIAQFYTTERVMKNYRQGGEADVRKFKGADLKGNTDVQVQSGSGLPKLKAAKQQFAINMAELGLEKDPKRLRDMLDLGEGEPDEIDLAFSQADRENELMRGLTVKGTTEELNPEAEEGEGSAAVPVKVWHNHEAHKKRHVRFMMTAEFESLQTTHPDIVRVFDEHIAMHDQAIQQQMMQQMQMMLAAQGGPEATAPEGGAMPMDGAGEVARRSAT